MSKAIQFFLQKKRGFLIGALVLITLLAFSPVLQNDFVDWDDPTHLLQVPEIRAINLENLQKIFQSHVHGVYIPLTTLTYTVEYHFFQFDPYIYHLTNLALHLGIVVMIYFFALRLGLSDGAAFIGSLIFAVHPMHVESVAWVTERKDVLYTFFYVLSLLFYQGYLSRRLQRPGPAKRYFLGACLCGVLSILSKPMALSLPLILLLLDWMHDRKIGMKCILEKLPLMIFIGGITLITYLHHDRMPMTSVMEGLLIWPWTFVFYLRHFIWPTVFVPVYRLPAPITIVHPVYAFSLLAFILIAGSMWIFRKRKFYLFAVAFYFLSVFFLLRFDMSRDTNIVADRWMYLPSLGLCFWIGSVCHHYLLISAEKKRIRIFMSVFLVILIGMLFFKTHSQCKVWKNTGTLWMHQISFYPREPIALYNMATYLRRLPDFAQDAENYRTRELKPLNVQVVLDLYQRALDVSGGSPDMHFQLAEVYYQIGRYTDALNEYQATAAIFPGYSDVLFKIAASHYALNDDENACVYLKKYQQWNEDPAHAKYASYLQKAENVLKCVSTLKVEDPQKRKFCLERAFEPYM